MLPAGDEAAGRQNLFHHAQAERETRIPPDRGADHPGGKAVAGMGGRTGRRAGIGGAEATSQIERGGAIEKVMHMDDHGCGIDADDGIGGRFMAAADDAGTRDEVERHLMAGPA